MRKWPHPFLCSLWRRDGSSAVWECPGLIGQFLVLASLRKLSFFFPMLGVFEHHSKLQCYHVLPLMAATLEHGDRILNQWALRWHPLGLQMYPYNPIYIHIYHICSNILTLSLSLYIYIYTVSFCKILAQSCAHTTFMFIYFFPYIDS